MVVSLSVYKDCIFRRTAGSPPGVFNCTREKLLGLMIRWTGTIDKHGSVSVVGTESAMTLHQQQFSSKNTPKKPYVSVTKGRTPICFLIFLHFWIEWHHVLNAFLENLMTVLSRHSPTCLKYTISLISWQFHTSTVFPFTSPPSLAALRSTPPQIPLNFVSLSYFNMSHLHRSVLSICSWAWGHPRDCNQGKENWVSIP